jgi:peptide/nickel transport system substrate-binding protein
MGRAYRAAAFAVVSGLVVSSCTGGGNPNPRASASAAAPSPGGTLRVGIQRWNRDFPYDPTAFRDPGAHVLFACCLLRTLYSYNGRPTSEGGTELRPDLAAGPPEVSADGLTWTFHVKPGLHYAPPLQRTEIVAQDFIRAIQRALSPAPRGDVGGPQLGGSEAAYFVPIVQGSDDYTAGKADTISGLEVPDPHTLRVRLTRPAGDLGYRFSLISTAPIPPNPFDPAAKFGVAAGHEGDGYGRFLVASGPYMVEGSHALDFSRPPGQQQPLSGLDPLVLVRNPSWQPSTDGLRKAYADRIEFNAFSNEPYTPEIGFGNRDTYRIAYAKKVEAGQIDLLLDSFPAADTVRRYKTDPSLRSQLVVNEVSALLFLSLNLALPPFDDVHVRRAANYAVRKQLVASAFQTRGRPVTPLDHLAPDAAQNNLLLNYHPYTPPGGTPNVAGAMHEMQLSTYDRDRDGRCDHSSCQRVVVWWRNDGPFPEVARLVQADLAQIGIALDVEMVSPNEMYQRCGDPAQHATLCQAFLLADYPNASTFFPSEFSSEALSGLPGGINYSLLGASPDQLRGGRYPVTSVPNVDDRIKSCDEAIGTIQIRCWADLDQYLMEEIVPEVPLLVDTAPAIFSDRIAIFSWGQVLAAPALANIALKPAS